MTSASETRVGFPLAIAEPLDPALERAASRSELDEFAALDELEFLSLQGRDYEGSSIICIVAKAIPANFVRPEVFQRYILYSVTELLRNSEQGCRFSVVYFHSAFDWEENCLGVFWLQSVYNSLPHTFRQRIAAVYCVHPSFSLRSGLLLFSPWLADRLYSKITFVSRLEFLEEFLAVLTELAIPGFVYEHDRTLEEHPLMDYGFQLDPVVSKSHMPEVVGSVEHHLPDDLEGEVTSI